MIEMKNIAPVVVYTYDRIGHLKDTIQALQLNHLALDTDLFVVSDGPKNNSAKKQIDTLRDYVDDIKGFRSINKIYRNKNLGAFESITSAEKQIISDYGRIISMEDDIVTSRNYLDFINSGLNYFEDAEDIFSVSGYCHPIRIENGYDSWLNIWHCPWGYGMWKKKYLALNLSENPYLQVLKNREKYKILIRYGDFFLDTLIGDYQKKFVAADARICGEMLLKDMKTVMPSISKVQNIGCDGSGAHSSETNRYDVELDTGQKRVFSFSSEFDINSDEFVFYSKFMNGGFFDWTKRRFRRALLQNKSARYLYKLIRLK